MHISSLVLANEAKVPQVVTHNMIAAAEENCTGLKEQLSYTFFRNEGSLVVGVFSILCRSRKE